MKWWSCFVVFFWVLGNSFGQEEGSAELFLDEYTDEFQETFFEGLKQKGIQNYDRAIQLFLDCKQLDAENPILDYELARAHFKNKTYVEAQEYGITALRTDPANYWYLETVVSILSEQGSSLKAMGYTELLNNMSLLDNLSQIYFKKKRYKEALEVLDALPLSQDTRERRRRIEDSLASNQRKKQTITKTTGVISVGNPVDGVKARIEQLLSQEAYANLQQESEKAMETYPLQPFFQYAYGYALFKNNQNSKGIEVLEGALDFIVDDVMLQNRIYQALSELYTAEGDLKKAAEYKNKINSKS
ncbi:MAG: hypothetical protein AAFU74_07245 [Bacteroidota bacterium]